jgi:hypothetical protein
MNAISLKRLCVLGVKKSERKVLSRHIKIFFEKGKNEAEFFF